jgi:hypothetical protein
VLLKQERLADAERVAVAAADRVEPDLSRDRSPRLAVWGVLMLRAASAAVRAGESEGAEEHLSLARMAAARLGLDTSICAMPFGPTNVVVASVNAAVELGWHGQVLALARDFPATGWVTPTWRARYKIDMAMAQIATRRISAAENTLLEAEAIAPDWKRYHALARDVVREAADHTTRRTAPIHELGPTTEHRPLTQAAALCPEHRRKGGKRTTLVLPSSHFQASESVN